MPDESKDTTKRCTRCGDPKVLEEFDRCRAGRYGRRAVCRTCRAAKRDEHREELRAVASAYYASHRQERWAYYSAHRKERAAYDAEYRASHREELLATAAARRRRHPQRHKARAAVAREIAAGRLTRLTCEECGDEPAEAHHGDYGKPLEVRWLCKPCHGAHHRRVGSK